jgi:type I restriction enzyme M protein
VNNFSDKVSFIWSVADLLRGPYRPNQYKDVMLPLTVLRRLDCVLEPTKDKVLETKKKYEGGKVKVLDPILQRVTGVPFFNTSRYTFEKLKGDPNHIAANLVHFIKGFSSRAREIIDHFGFEEQIDRWTRPTVCIWSLRNTAIWICTPARCPTSRWGTSSRS